MICFGLFVHILWSFVLYVKQIIIIKDQIFNYESWVRVFLYFKGYFANGQVEKYNVLTHQWCNEENPSKCDLMVFLLFIQGPMNFATTQTWKKLIWADKLQLYNLLVCMVHFTSEILLLFLILRASSPKGLVNPLGWFDLSQDITLMWMNKKSHPLTRYRWPDASTSLGQ